LRRSDYERNVTYRWSYEQTPNIIFIKKTTTTRFRDDTVSRHFNFKMTALKLQEEEEEEEERKVVVYYVEVNCHVN
jgi:hypothetical protein